MAPAAASHRWAGFDRPFTAYLSRMNRPSSWLWGTYFVIAFYLGARLKTGDLVVRFGFAFLLFLVIPGIYHLLTKRATKSPDA